jgi:hypothetical protein
MAIAPGLRPDDNSTVSGSQVSGTDASHAWSGTPDHGGDPTVLEGQYPPGNWGSALFGGQLPTGTGAPGTRGATYTSGTDPTIEPGQLNEGISGLGPADTARTGAPGGSTTPNTEGGSRTISFTDPGTQPGVGAYRSEQVSDDLDGPRDSTQANDQGYASGGPQLPGLAGNEPQAGRGRYQPGGSGRVLRGGRAVNP